METDGHMNQLFGIAVLTLLSLQVCAGGIYKWVDENGKVHYSDRPVGKGVESVKVPTGGRASSVAAPTMQQRREKQQRLLKAYERKRNEKKSAKLKAAKAKAKAKRNCVLARDRLKSIADAGYLYRVGEDGRRQPLSAAARTAAHAQAEALVKQWCG